ncbi:hypothetical protein ACQP1V_00790 [Microtetraspora malaysiensis]|uniref:hypothetical protein n=1 Tax=Microtetraspora malaysiensis TaxID=161358 RepID=UPI003D8B8682
MPTIDRTAVITGLRALTAFLEANPAVPVPDFPILIRCFPKRGSDTEMRAEVDRIAELLGTEIDPDDLPFGHYTTGLDFSPIRYEVTAILADARARHAAESSYYGCVQPDPIDSTTGSASAA